MSATNVATSSNSQSDEIDNFGDSNTSIADLINNSKNNTAFNKSGAGVYYGTYAWK